MRFRNFGIGLKVFCADGVGLSTVYERHVPMQVDLRYFFRQCFLLASVDLSS
jgi:hypothetical protein